MHDFNAKMRAAHAGDRHSGLAFTQSVIGPDAERQLTFDCSNVHFADTADLHDPRCGDPGWFGENCMAGSYDQETLDETVP